MIISAKQLRILCILLAVLDLGRNASRAPYAGNAIFLHCWKEPDYPTGGCVAVSGKSMIRFLQTVAPGTSVTIC